jgi:TonB family protein
MMKKDRHSHAVLLICLAFALSCPLTNSFAQSEGAKDKKLEPDLSITATLRPKITYREKAPYTNEARNNLTHGTVALSVVFRLEGTITDIKVVRGLPDGLTESAIEAAKKVRFEPAVKNGNPVSVRGILELTFDMYGLDEGSIRRLLGNDFPVLSSEVVKNMAAAIYKRGDRTTETAWSTGRLCFKQGEVKLLQAEQEELSNLMFEAIGGLKESSQKSYRELLEKSKKQLLNQGDERLITEVCFSGMADLPPEKRSRAEALYNKAAAIGVALL